MTRTQVYIPDELLQTAKFVAKQQKVTISQLLRKGLEIAVKKKPKSGEFILDNLVGMGETKEGVEAAVNHNDIYDI